MAFAANAEQIARSAMLGIDPVLADKYAGLIKFLSLNPDAAVKMQGQNAPEVGSEAYITVLAANFVKSRVPRAPKPPATVPDEMVSFILQHYFNVSEDSLERAKNEHLLSMGSENLVGELLERYLAHVMEPKGWIWCSGSTVRAVDLIKPPTRDGENWTSLQVKNRNNSENSSSSAIRHGTDIKKWFRTFSKKAGSNWDAFPDAETHPLLSEAGFKDFVQKYLASLR